MVSYGAGSVYFENKKPCEFAISNSAIHHQLYISVKTVRKFFGTTTVGDVTFNLNKLWQCSSDSKGGYFIVRSSLKEGEGRSEEGDGSINSPAPSHGLDSSTLSVSKVLNNQSRPVTATIAFKVTWTSKAHITS